MFWAGVTTLVAKAKQGDSPALDLLCRLAQPYLLRLAQKVLGPGWPDKSISDLTQETWVRAWQSIGAFEGADNDGDTGAMLRAWLARTMKNVWHNQLRFDNAQCRMPESGLVSLMGGSASQSSLPGIDPPAADATPSENLRREEQQGILERAVTRLPDPNDRDIVRLRFFEGLAFADIGQRLQRDESTIRYRLQRILEFLGDELKDLL